MLKENIIYISCDAGMSDTKYAWFNMDGSILAESMSTVMTKNDVNEDSTFKGDSYLVKYNNESYLIGGSQDYELDNNNSKLTLTHELCVYTSIANVILKMNLPLNMIHCVDLSLNLPLEDFKQEKQKEEYIKKYLNKQINITVNGIAVQFTISNVRCYYEGQGTMIVNDNTENGYFYIIDIGGKNDTHILFKNFSPEKGKNSMTGNGVLTLLQNIATDLSIKYNYDFSIQDIKDIITGINPRIDGFNESFNKHSEKLVKQIKNQIQKFRPNLAFTQFIFTGGGTVVLKDQLTQIFKDGYNIIISQDAQFDNCKGALMKIKAELQ